MDAILLRVLKLDDDALALLVGGVFGRRPPVTNGCRKAAWGLILRSGSQTKHLAMKSTKSSSLQRSTCWRLFVPGRLRRPLELTTGRGAPLGSTVLISKEAT